MITGISGFWFFGPKMAVSWRICFLQKKEKAETPIFIVFWGCALFGPSCLKWKIRTPTQKKKILTDNWKAHFLRMFYIFLFFFCFLGFLWFFVEGFKGQVRWPVGPPHLALNPPYLFLFCFFVFFVFFVCFSFFVVCPFPQLVDMHMDVCMSLYIYVCKYAWCRVTLVSISDPF